MSNDDNENTFGVDNKVELIGHYGSDLTHALSAWTSTSRDLDIVDKNGKTKRDRVPALLNMLASEGHHTPFEKSSLHFLVTSDIASHIHILKHRIGVSVNGECLHGDTEVTFVDCNGHTSKQKKMSIRDIYKKWTNGRRHQNTEKDKKYQQKRIRNMKIRVLNEDTMEFEHAHISDVMFSGRKTVYKIHLEDGKTITCSKDHRIFTENGWATIANKKLRIGIRVATNGIRTHINNRPRTFPNFFDNELSFVNQFLGDHPYVNRKHEPRARYSARFVKIAKIEKYGEVDTYDLEIEGKWKNFVANGIVVHNSARYKELKEDKLYLPSEWPEEEKKIYLAHMEQAYAHYHRSLESLTKHYEASEGLSNKEARKRAKECARFYLPYGNQLTCDVMFNFRSFAHFVRLRYSKHAQREICNIARDMLIQVQNTGDFNKTLAAFGFVDKDGVLVPPFN